MADFEIQATIPQDFSGIVRLFPLPNLVMFPHVVQPLHIFEPRYCEMLEDALVDDQLIAMALLLPGWENDYEGRPAIAPVACLGKVVCHSPLANSKHNILLQGISRVQVELELPPVRAFRQAKVKLITDTKVEIVKRQVSELQSCLLDAFRTYTRHQQMAVPIAELENHLNKEMPLEVLTDIVTFLLPAQPQVKLDLLGEANVERRARQLLDLLHNPRASSPSPSDRSRFLFPPRFSVN